MVRSFPIWERSDTPISQRRSQTCSCVWRDPTWVVCTGIYGEALTISVRTRAKQGAGSVLRDMVGDEGVWGGHGNVTCRAVRFHCMDSEARARKFCDPTTMS